MWVTLLLQLQLDFAVFVTVRSLSRVRNQFPKFRCNSPRAWFFGTMEIAGVSLGGSSLFVAIVSALSGVLIFYCYNLYFRVNDKAAEKQKTGIAQASLFSFAVNDCASPCTLYINTCLFRLFLTLGALTAARFFRFRRRLATGRGQEESTATARQEQEERRRPEMEQPAG